MYRIDCKTLMDYESFPDHSYAMNDDGMAPQCAWMDAHLLTPISTPGLLVCVCVGTSLCPPSVCTIAHEHLMKQM